MVKKLNKKKLNKKHCSHDAWELFFYLIFFTITIFIIIFFMYVVPCVLLKKIYNNYKIMVKKLNKKHCSQASLVRRGLVA